MRRKTNKDEGAVEGECERNQWPPENAGREEDGKRSSSSWPALS